MSNEPFGMAFDNRTGSYIPDPEPRTQERETLVNEFEEALIYHTKTLTRAAFERLLTARKNLLAALAAEPAPEPHGYESSCRCGAEIHNGRCQRDGCAESEFRSAEERMRELIADNAFAAGFQTLEQYRRALLAALFA